MTVQHSKTQNTHTKGNIATKECIGGESERGAKLFAASFWSEVCDVCGKVRVPVHPKECWSLFTSK